MGQIICSYCSAANQEINGQILVKGFAQERVIAEGSTADSGQLQG